MPRSEESLDEEAPPIWARDDLKGESPPKLAPISGVLGTQCDYLVRPVAHRPSIPSWSSPSTGYVSGGGSCSSSSEARSFNDREEDQLLEEEGEEIIRTEPSPLQKEFIIARSRSPSSLLAEAHFWQTRGSSGSPSGSEKSGDVESILKEKISEINQLRKTLEQNEQVIVKVYAEKEQLWRHELERVRAYYEAELDASKEEMAKTKKLLRYSQISNLDETGNSFDWPHKNWRQSLALPPSSQKSKSGLIISNNNNNNNNALQDFKNEEEEVSREKMLQCELDALRVELAKTKKELSIARDNVTKDRERWQEERDRMTCYQEQLHQNYVQAWKRSRTLEVQVEELAARLDKLDHGSPC